MTAFASGNSCFRNSHEQKRKNSAKQNSWIVCRFSMEGSCRAFGKVWCLFSKPRKSLCDRIPLTFATASRCLHSLTFGRHDRFCRDFLCAKACHPDQRFCRWKLLFYQQPCAKAPEFCKAEFWESLPVLYGGILPGFCIAGDLHSNAGRPGI